LDSVFKFRALKFRQKAKLLLNHLHSNASDKLAWDKYNVISINDIRIAESNIVDLVNDAMRSRKTARPTGKHHFATLLYSVNMPCQFIGNQDLWLGNPSTSNSINTLQLPNIVLLHAVATSCQVSDSRDLSTDDIDNASELYQRELN